MRVEMVYVKSTKRTRFYRSTDDDAPIKNIYIQSDAFGTGYPMKVTVEVN